MEIRLLGPVELLSARGPVPIGSAKQRALLAFLALHPQRLLTYDALIDGLWGHDPPDETLNALRFHVSRLRGILRQADDADRLRTRPGGYQLVLAEDAVDVLRFEKTIAAARRARSEGATPEAVSRAFHDALDLWVGPALADINGEPFVVGERRRLEELRLAATEDYFAAELAGGRHAQAVAELERMVDHHPLRERLWELLITALYRSGRQAHALAAYQRLRRILADELGLEPSAPLRELEHMVLVQDTVLARPSTRPGPVSDTNKEPLTPADAKRPHAKADVRVPRGLATTALALGILALGLFWLGAVSTLIALLAGVCGSIAVRSAITAGRPVDRRAILAIATSVVAFSAGVGLLLYRYVTPDGDTEDRIEVSDDSDRGNRPAVPDDTETDRTMVSNDFSVHDGLTPIAAIQVGDCFNLLYPQPPPPGASVTQLLDTGGTVSRVPCEEPHESETYHLFELGFGPYPGDEQVQAQAIERCSVQFQSYVGVTPDESALDFYYVYPDQSVWKQGIRLGGCSLHDATGLDLTGSMAGSRR
jgi:DNA-binding SARP family transcriptional activator